VGIPPNARCRHKSDDGDGGREIFPSKMTIFDSEPLRGDVLFEG
jgi:hypothetical protein